MCGLNVWPLSIDRWSANVLHKSVNCWLSAKLIYFSIVLTNFLKQIIQVIVTTIERKTKKKFKQGEDYICCFVYLFARLSVNLMAWWHLELELKAKNRWCTPYQIRLSSF